MDEKRGQPGLGPRRAGEAGRNHRAGRNTSTTQHSTPSPRKWERILRVLCNRSLTRFEAIADYHDTCLNSTVATIQRKGVRVDRHVEAIPGYQGASVRCCRYWIAKDQREAAERLLSTQNKRKAA